MWALLDLNTLELCRVGAVELHYGSDEPLAISTRFRLPAVPLEEVGTRTVRYSDVDVNNHMNNTRYPDMLCLGSGGCRICRECAYPEPCRFPDKACSSMEGYGLFVTQVCRDNHCAYSHWEKTITYTACVLF